MGNPKQKWTSDEEEALRAGVAKHGPGKWKLIQKDPEFNQFLHSRSNIDLKDKWRNMSAAVQGSREKLRTPKPKDASALALIPSVTTHSHPHPQSQSQSQSHPQLSQSQPQPLAVVPEPISIHDSNKDDSASAKDLPDPKIARRYNELIFEALSSVQHQTGLDSASISAYIQKRIDVAPSFKKQFPAKLKKLVQQDKLEKVDSLYRIKRNSVETNNQKENWARQQYTSFYSKVGESLEEAAKTAAFKVVEAETKSCMAAEAVKEAEKFSKLAEETDSIFLFAKEIFDRCKDKKEVVIEKMVCNKRKCITTIKGLELFGVKFSDASKKLGKKFATGVMHSEFSWSQKLQFSSLKMGRRFQQLDLDLMLKITSKIPKFVHRDVA